MTKTEYNILDRKRESLLDALDKLDYKLDNVQSQVWNKKCKKHPSYKALHKPTSECWVCYEIWKMLDYAGFKLQ